MVNANDRSYLVYLYQYNDMKHPKWGAQRRTYRDARDLDSLPPVVIRWWSVAAMTQREAIQTGRILNARRTI